MFMRTLSLGLLAAAAFAAPASATSFTFNTTVASDTSATFKTFTSLVSSLGTTMNLRATAWHAVDRSDSTNVDDIDPQATLGLFTSGLGVIANGDNGGAGGLHQIDNLNGVDFVMLQFDKNVTLTGITRSVFALPGTTPMDSDAAYWADTQGWLGGPTSWNTAVNLDPYQVDENVFTSIPGTAATPNSATVSTTKVASTWLISADFVNRGDGFKLGSITVNDLVAPPITAVPEPATWGMMILGFGMVGAAVRRRRARPAANA